MKNFANKKGQFVHVIQNNVRILKYVNRYCKTQVVISVVSAVLSSVIAIINLLVSRYIVNTITNSSIEYFREVVSIIILPTILSIALGTINLYVFTYIAPRNLEKIHLKMRSELYRKAATIQYKSYDETSFYNKFKIAIEQSDQRVLAVIKTFSNFLSGVLGVGSLAALLGMLRYEVLVIIGINAVVSFILNLKRSKLQHEFVEKRIPLKREQSYSERVFFLREYSKELRLFPKMPNLLEKHFTEATDRVIEIINRFGKLFQKNGVLSNISSNMATCITMMFLAIMIMTGKMSIGDFFAVMNGSQQFSNRLVTLLGVFPQLYEHSLYIENFLEFVESYPSEKLTGKPLETVENVCFRHVCFSYPDKGSQALTDISFTVNRGQCVALVGENGAGKSTIVKLLTRLYDVDKGSIEINGVPVQEFNLSAFRDAIGVVFQDYTLYALPIIDNILMRPIENVHDDEQIVIEALKFVGLYDKVSKLPNGIYSKVTREFGGEGIYLSGGEMQKIALARVYVKQNDILIFDEPSSALDPFSEREMFNNMQALIKNKCTILISHRLNSIVDSDQICVLKGGRIIEKGTHSKLMNRRGVYYSMYMEQNKTQSDNTMITNRDFS